MKRQKVGKSNIWAWSVFISSMDGKIKTQLLEMSIHSLGCSGKDSWILKEAQVTMVDSGRQYIILLLAAGANRKEAPALTCNAH